MEKKVHPLSHSLSPLENVRFKQVIWNLVSTLPLRLVAPPLVRVRHTHPIYKLHHLFLLANTDEKNGEESDYQ